MTRPILDVLSDGHTLPEGCDAWGWRYVHADFRSSRDYRWPWPGQWAEAPGPIIVDNRGACPREVGDGICLAATFAGARSGGIVSSTILLCAYASGDLLGRDGEKLRLRRAFVVDVLDLRGLARRSVLRNANLCGADLCGADLYGADLYGANLRGANLRNADLRNADLRNANLRGANLCGADLRGADLRGANLRGSIGVTLPPGWRLTDAGIAVQQDSEVTS